MEDYVMPSKLLLLPPRWLNQLPDLGCVYFSAGWASSLFVLSSTAICHFWNMSLSTGNARGHGAKRSFADWNSSEISVAVGRPCNDVMEGSGGK